MLTLLFVVLLLTIFGKLLIFAIKAAWGITKILLNIVLLPLIIIGMFAGGLTYLALIVLAIVGLVSLIKGYN
jgi:hypothetical protein